MIRQKRLTAPLLLSILLCWWFCAGFNPKTAKGIDTPQGIYVFGDQTIQLADEERPDNVVTKILRNYRTQASYRELKIVYPYNESIFPPEIAAPTLEWIEIEADIKIWLVMVTFDDRHKPLYVLCEKPKWTPNQEIWELMKKHSVKGPARISILGVSGFSLSEVLSRGVVNIWTSRDEVGAPIMFRRVPPSFAYASKHPESIEWCLADISSYEPPAIIMSKQKVCSSCHTFSRDGRTIGMDVDYNKDKGGYFLTGVDKNIVLNDRGFMSWNNFPRADNKQNTGLFSRISPDGANIVSTVSEILFLIKIADPYFSQLFFPLQGHLATYSKTDKKITLLTGADLPDFVQTDPSWSPDGNNVVFARAPVNHHLLRQLAGQTIFSVDHNDIDRLNKQYPVQFNLFRIPFNHGKGGRAEPVPGASYNGKSNYFPRYSPDGKWIVFTQSETGLAIQPDSKLYIMPSTGGEAKMMRCNRRRLNSWHTWSPNSRWLAFVSKENTPYTELFLTHIDDNGNDSPPVLLARFNKPGYAINVPEFANIPFRSIIRIAIQGN
ncbi:TolB family protein [Thermodesulfobacteriota bacterium]